MNVGTINGIYRYPVKSMGGEPLDQTDLLERGLPGDRAWAVRDEERGGIRGGKRFPELMQCSASYETEPPPEGSSRAMMKLPDGRNLAIDDPSAPDELSHLVDSPVTVWPLLPADRLDHYRRGAPVLEDMEAEFRRVFGRTEDEPLPDISKFPEFVMEFESPPGTYFDAFPVMIMSTESLAYLQKSAPDQNFDIRRFRPNILLETQSTESFPEREWIGRKLRLGGAELTITMGCPRCVMTTHGFDDVPRDTRIMRSLVNLADGDLGVYATISGPGTVKVGDPAELL
jgi:uncharacterized protein YcbX